MALRFKLDENITLDATTLLGEAGHEVETVLQERLGGRADPQVLKACRDEMVSTSSGPRALPFAPCAGEALIRNSSRFAPAFSFSASQRGVSPRPHNFAPVFGSRYFAGTLRFAGAALLRAGRRFFDPFLFPFAGPR